MSTRLAEIKSRTEAMSRVYSSDWYHDLKMGIDSEEVAAFAAHAPQDLADLLALVELYSRAVDKLGGITAYEDYANELRDEGQRILGKGGAE